MKKDMKKLYTYAIIMIVCVIIIVLIAAMSETRIDNFQTEYEGKLTASQTEIEALEKKIAGLDEENYKLKEEAKKNLTLQSDIEKNNQALNDLTEVYRLIENGDTEKAKEKFNVIETNGFDNAALAFYGALEKLLK